MDTSMMSPIFAVTTVLHFVIVDCKTAKSLLLILCSIVSHQRQVNAEEKKKGSGPYSLLQVNSI